MVKKDLMGVGTRGKLIVGENKDGFVEIEWDLTRKIGWCGIRFYQKSVEDILYHRTPEDIIKLARKGHAAHA